jgi:hypothetical protein
MHYKFSVAKGLKNQRAEHLSSLKIEFLELTRLLPNPYRFIILPPDVYIIIVI